MISSKISEIEIKSIDPAITKVSRSGKRFVQSLMRQYWRMNVTWVKMKNQDAQALYVQLSALQGMVGNTSLSIPILGQHKNLTGVISLTLPVAAGENQVTMTGYTGEFTVGGVFNFSGHSKLYQVVSQVDSLLTFHPPLRKAVSSDTINYTAPTIKVYRTKEDAGWKMQRVNSQLTDEFEEELE